MGHMTEFENAIKGEVATFPGAEVTFVMGGKHPQAKLVFQELIKKVAFSGTPSDRFALTKSLADIRRSLRQMGAERASVESPDEDEALVEKVYHKPNDGAAKRALQIVGGTDAEPEPTLHEKMVAAKQVAGVERQIAASIDFYREQQDRRAQLAPVAVDDAKVALAAELQARVDAIVDGVYFDLPDTIYHAIPALGSGSIGDLIISPGTFWRGSWLDPDRAELDEEQTSAQLIGKAYHAAVLEPETFAARYVREPAKSDYPQKGLLTSDAAVKAALKEAGAPQSVSGETNEERAERLIDIGYEGAIWPYEYACWQREISHLDPIPTPIKGKVWDEIAVDMQRFAKVANVQALVEGGFGEVSVIWTDEHGLRCKCRFDKLLPGHWVDLKTFANPRRKVTLQAINDAFRYDRHYVQGAHYGAGAEALRAGNLSIIGAATEAQIALFDDIRRRDQPLTCWYVYQEKGGIPNLLAREYRFYRENGSEAAIRELEEAGADEAHMERARRFGEIAQGTRPQKTALYRRGVIEIEQAKKIFALYSQVYKPGEPWAMLDAVGAFDDADFNRFWLEGEG